MKLSVQMTMNPDRVGYFEHTLGTYTGPREDLELVMVEESCVKEPRLEEIKDQLLDVFGSVRWIVVDSRLYDKPVRFHTGPLCINIGIMSCSNEAVLATHPECYQLGTIERAKKIFKPWEVVYFETYMSWSGIYRELASKNGENVLDLPSVQKPPFVSKEAANSWFWFSVLVPKSVFERVGGYDEPMMENWGCDDCNLGWAFVNNGVPIKIENRAQVLHLWHAAKDPRDYPAEYSVNYQLCEDMRTQKRMKCNEGIDWGRRDIVIHEEVWN